MAALQYPRVLFTRSTCGPRPVAGPLAITILFNFINFEKYSFNSLLNKFLSSSSCMQDLVFDELWWSTFKTLLILCYHYDHFAGYSNFVLWITTSSVHPYFFEFLHSPSEMPCGTIWFHHVSHYSLSLSSILLAITAKWLFHISQ